MKAQNRFLRATDFNDEKFLSLKIEIESFYKHVMRGIPHDEGPTVISPEKTIILWSREWEYPWAFLVGNMVKDHIVLDCGCGGSPFLPFLVKKTGCRGYGIDIEHGDFFVREQEKALKRIRYLCDLKRYYIDPKLMFGNNPKIAWGDMADLNFSDNQFDRVFCISVIEHLKIEKAKKGLEEMKRVLKPGGKLIITTDYKNPFDHNKKMEYTDIIEWSGLELDGDTDFSIPSPQAMMGKCHVVGFVLRK